MNNPVSTSYPELLALLARVKQRADEYLRGRPDEAEQRDHLRHIGDRARWIYAHELRRRQTGDTSLLPPPPIPPREKCLLDIVVLSHDMGKWAPREGLRMLIPQAPAELDRALDEIHITPSQRELFRLGVRKRLDLSADGYTVEYDSVHHLVSAFVLAADPTLGFERLAAADRQRILTAIIGHQFGGYFKEHLLAISLQDLAIKTAMLVEVSRPERTAGDVLASAFHDADLADLLFVGSLERGDGDESRFHPGGVLKILLINFGNYLNQTPRGPRSLLECVQVSEGSAQNAAREFITQTAIARKDRWRQEALTFLTLVKDPSVMRRIESEVERAGRSAEASLAAVRDVLYPAAAEFIRTYARL